MTAAIPRWRGFNIVDLFSTSVRWKEHFPMDDGMIAEDDFAMIRELGFDFVRIPVSYLFFGKGLRGREVDEDRLWLIDRVIEFGRRHDVHVLLAFHRGPGYCITGNSQFDFPEHGDLFTEDDDLRDFVTWWRTLAERYRDVPASILSFNLLNEPADIDDETFDRTFIPAIEAIHAVTPDRLVHAEGRFMWDGSSTVLAPPTRKVATMPNVVSAVHLYHPFAFTHYGCPWQMSAPSVDVPSWPYQPSHHADSEVEIAGDAGRFWDKEALRAALTPYLDYAEEGIPVHVGEMGAYSALPHDAYLAYMTDVIALLDEYGIGYALWNFRGPFGVLDTGRSDVRYEDFHGHRLDRELTDIVRGG